MSIVIKEHEPLKNHTVFKIGGPARFFIETATANEFVQAIRQSAASGIPWHILGAGSNVLVADAGFPGTIIHPRGGALEVRGNFLHADAGVSMARAVAESVKNNLCGFEWGIGIPGTIGGSVVGNAGCFGGEMKDAVERVRVFNTNNGDVAEFSNADIAFGYRDSMFKHRPELVVLDVTLQLHSGDGDAAAYLVRDYTSKRVHSQDIGSQSAGCIFKNISWNRRDIDPEQITSRFPEFMRFQGNPGIPAGFLVDQLGLKGMAVGGARISERHGNFIINGGNATADDVIILIGIIKERVHRTYGVLLEEEIRCIGF